MSASRLLVAAVAVLAAGCSAPSHHVPTRGFLLISIDTLRADHLSAYGYPRPTSPFLDSLAARGALFEQAIAPYPSTLTSHMSLFTGLYPAQHGVYPPDNVLAEQIATLPEAFGRAGFRTAGFTEGGFMLGRYGFARGFEVFRDDAARTPLDVEETARRGLEFLRGLGEEERFFLFLHTYAVHSPYDPPAAFVDRFWDGGPPPPFEPTGVNMERFNLRGKRLPPGTGAYLSALYDAQIAHVDEVLRGFFTELDALGLSDDTTVVLLSDHGEELLEHGRLGHTQLYPEILRVPLLMVDPRLPGGHRVRRPVRLVDVAPTLWELAALPGRPPSSGRSLVPDLRGKPPAEGKEAYAELDAGGTRSVLWRGDGGEGLHQLLVVRKSAKEWSGREEAFDLPPGTPSFVVESFEKSRWIAVSAGRTYRRRFEIWPDRPRAIPVPRGERRVRVSAKNCTVTRWNDRFRRCFSFRITSPTVQRIELFDLERDPLAQTDLSGQAHERMRAGLAVLRRHRFSAVAPPSIEALDAELEERLRALGYLQ